MASTPNTVGVASGYIPAEFPKVVHDPNGKTALAQNPAHLSLLEEQGWSEAYVAPPPPPPPVKLPASSELQAELMVAKATINQMVKEAMEAVMKHDALNALYVAAVSELEALKSDLAAVPPAPPPPPADDKPAATTPVTPPLKKKGF